MELTERIRELIAIGASMGANCQPCLKYHVDKAIQSGATRDEIRDAIKMGTSVKKGAMVKMDEFARGIDPEAVERSSGGCCECS